MKCPGILEALLHYSSVRYVNVNDMRLGLVFRSLQLLVFGYVVGYSIVAQQSYLQYDPVVGTSTIKVKGSGYKNISGTPSVFDAQDLIVPPTMQGAFFITTRFHHTLQNQNEICSASPDGSTNSGQKCQSDADCTAGDTTFHGLMNGTCAHSGYCFIQTWCPLEDDPHDSTSNLIFGIRAFSVFIRTNIQFPEFGITLTSGKDPIPGLSLFELYDMVTDACQGPCDFEQMRQRGAVILAKAEFDCKASDTDACKPTWEFSRIDEGDGFNFRTASYINTDETKRDMKKLYGIRVVVAIYGQAGRFSIVALLVALGAGLGLLGLASLVADFLLQHCWPKREKFLHDKFCEVNLEQGGFFDENNYSAIDEKNNKIANPLLEALNDEDFEEIKHKKMTMKSSPRELRKISQISQNSKASSVGSATTGGGVEYMAAGWQDFSERSRGSESGNIVRM